MKSAILRELYFGWVHYGHHDRTLFWLIEIAFKFYRVVNPSVDAASGDAGADAGLGARELVDTDAEAAAVSSALAGFAEQNAALLQLRKSMSIATTAANSVANLEEIADISVAGIVACMPVMQQYFISLKLIQCRNVTAGK